MREASTKRASDVITYSPANEGVTAIEKRREEKRSEVDLGATFTSNNNMQIKSIQEN